MPVHDCTQQVASRLSAIRHGSRMNALIGCLTRLELGLQRFGPCSLSEIRAVPNPRVEPHEDPAQCRPLDPEAQCAVDQLRPRTRSPEVAETATSWLPSLSRPSDVPPWRFHLGRPLDGSARKLRAEVAFPLARFSPIRPDACHADVNILDGRLRSRRCSTLHPFRRSERRSNAHTFRSTVTSVLWS